MRRGHPLVAAGSSTPASCPRCPRASFALRTRNPNGSSHAERSSLPGDWVTGFVGPGDQAPNTIDIGRVGARGPRAGRFGWAVSVASPAGKSRSRVRIEGACASCRWAVLGVARGARSISEMAYQPVGDGDKRFGPQRRWFCFVGTISEMAPRAQATGRRSTPGDQAALRPWRRRPGTTRPRRASGYDPRVTESTDARVTESTGG